MKKFLYLSTFLLGFVFFASAQNNIAPAVKGQIFGTSFSEKKVIDASQVPNKIKNGKKKKMQVRGVVTEVCAKKGCFMNVKIDDDKNLFIKMKDYGFFVPMNLVGKEVILDGVAYKEVTSVEELRHYAEDSKKSKEEIDAITQPEESYRFTADGIKILN